MCVGSAIRVDIRVSIQDRNAPDRVTGHLATGILVDGDAVLIPNPPEVILARPTELEALIFPLEAGDHSVIDAEDVWKQTRFGLRGASPTAVWGKLLHHSTYAAQISEVDAGALGSTLEQLGGDVWEALIRLGAIDPAIREIDPSLLERVADIERRQHQPKLAAHDYDSYGPMADDWCIIFCFCPKVPGK